MRAVEGVFKGAGVASALLGVLGGLHFDPSLALVLLGVVIYGIATYRRDSREILRAQNADLADRNVTLEAEKVRLEAENLALKSRPDIQKMYELLDRHDRHAQARDTEIIEAFKGVANTVQANTEALRLWATARSLEGFGDVRAGS